MKKIIYNLKINITLLLSLISIAAIAQGPPPPPATPIDGGLFILLAVIGGYTIKKVIDYKKKK